MSQAIVKISSESSTLNHLFIGAVMCVGRPYYLFFGQWEVSLKVKYGFCPITIKFNAQLLVAFLLHPDKIIDAWVGNLDLRLVVWQSKKKSIFDSYFNTGKAKNFFSAFFMFKKRPSFTNIFIDSELYLHFFLSHGNNN